MAALFSPDWELPPGGWRLAPWRGTGQLERERATEPGLRVRICQHLHLAAGEETGDPSPSHPPTPQQPECLVWASGIPARVGVGASGHVLEAPLPFFIKQPLTPSLGKWTPHFPSELSAQV